MNTILHETGGHDEGDDLDDLIDMVQDSFTRAHRVLGHGDARRYIQLREQDLYQRLEAMGLEHRVPAARQVYAAFWRLHADI